MPYDVSCVTLVRRQLQRVGKADAPAQGPVPVAHAPSATNNRTYADRSCAARIAEWRGSVTAGLVPLLLPLIATPTNPSPDRGGNRRIIREEGSRVSPESNEGNCQL